MDPILNNVNAGNVFAAYNAAIDGELKSEKTDGTTASPSLTTTEAEGVPTAGVPASDAPALESPAEGAMDPDRVTEAYGKMSGGEGVDLKAVEQEKQQMLAAFKAKVESSGVLTSPNYTNIYNVMQLLMQLMLECAQEQAKLGHELRFNKMSQQSAEILAQAEMQKSMAIAGMVASVVSATIQTVVAVAMTKLGNNDQKTLEANHGVPTAEANLANARLEGDLPKAQESFDQMAVSFNKDGTVSAQTAEGIRTQVDPGKTKAAIAEDVSAAKAKLNQAERTLDEKEQAVTDAQTHLDELKKDVNADKTAVSQAEAELSQAKVERGKSQTEVDSLKTKVARLEGSERVAAAREELDSAIEGKEPEKILEARAKYRDAVNAEVDSYKGEVDLAREKYMALRDSPTASKAEVKAAQDVLKTRQNEYQVASAGRTLAFSNEHNGVAYMSEADIKMDIKARQAEYGQALESVRTDPAARKISPADSSFKRDFVLRCMQTIDQGVQGGFKIFEAKVTAAGAKAKETEYQAEELGELAKQAQKLVDGILQLLEAMRGGLRV